MKNFFKTEDAMIITGLKRHHLEHYRKLGIVKSVSNKPLRWDYKTIQFLFIINLFRDIMNQKLALDCAKNISFYYPNLEFLEDSSKLMFISELGKNLLIYTSQNKNELNSFENEDNHLIRYYESSKFLDIDDTISGKRMQIIVDSLYVIFIELIKSHIEKTCIDLGYSEKIPSSLSLSQ